MSARLARPRVCIRSWISVGLRSPTALRRLALLRADPIAPRRFGALLQLAVELEVDLLVEEAQQTLDPADLGKRVLVVPDEVVNPGGRVVAGCALVGAPGHGVSWLEVGDHVLARDVPARRQAGLEQCERTPGLREHPSVQGDTHVAVAAQDVDPVIWISWVDVYLLVLLEPAVQPVKVKGDQVLDRRGVFDRGRVV